MRRQEQIALTLWLLFAACASGCTSEGQARHAANTPASAATGVAAPQPDAPSPVAVQLFEVQPSPAGGALAVPAFVSVEDTAVLLAERDGTVTKLEAQEGGRVSSGQVIATLSSDDQLAQLRQAELEVDRLKVEERQYESLVAVNRNELEREQSLYRDGLSSKRDLERAQFRLDGATSELEKARLTTRTAQAKVGAVKYEIEKGTLRAPISGVVTRRYVNLGTSVQKGDRVAELSRLSPLQVKFQLPQAERGRLTAGSVVALTLPGSERAVARARVRRLDPVADATSSTFGYLADIIGGAGLIPGTAVNVQLPRQSAAPTFWVPRAAFNAAADLRQGTSATLLVVEGGRCGARGVTVVGSEGDQIEVAGGLDAGDRVIVAPPAGLKAGDPVTVE